MDVPAAWITLAVGVGLLLVASFPLRTRVDRPVLDGLLVLAGAGIGVGGLLFLENVGLASWIATPVVLGVATLAHVRALFAGAGPFRT
jgi:hypothetical protein